MLSRTLHEKVYQASRTQFLYAKNPPSIQNSEWRRLQTNLHNQTLGSSEALQLSRARNHRSKMALGLTESYTSTLKPAMMAPALPALGRRIRKKTRLSWATMGYPVAKFK